MYIHLQKFNVAIYIQIRITMCLVSKITIIKYTCNENNFPKESTDSIHLHIYNFNVDKVEENYTLQQMCCCNHRFLSYFYQFVYILTKVLSLVLKLFSLYAEFLKKKSSDVDFYKCEKMHSIRIECLNINALSDSLWTIHPMNGNIISRLLLKFNSFTHIH